MCIRVRPARGAAAVWTLRPFPGGPVHERLCVHVGQHSSEQCGITTGEALTYRSSPPPTCCLPVTTGVTTTAIGHSCNLGSIMHCQKAVSMELSKRLGSCPDQCLAPGKKQVYQHIATRLHRDYYQVESWLQKWPEIGQRAPVSPCR